MAISSILIAKEVDKLKVGAIAPILTAVWTSASPTDQEKIAKMLLTDPARAGDILKHYIIQNISQQAANNINTFLSSGTVTVTDLDTYFT